MAKVELRESEVWYREKESASISPGLLGAGARSLLDKKIVIYASGGVREMCDFRVSVDVGGGVEEVAEGVLYAKKEEGRVVLTNILGSPVEVKDAVIDEVDVKRERMILTSSPLLSRLQDFIELHRRCLSDGALLGQVEASWIRVKELGDEAVAELKRRRIH